jgi:hypothetical protein
MLIIVVAAAASFGLLGPPPAFAGRADDLTLARELASQESSDGAIDRILSSHNHRMRSLLALANSPPKQLNPSEQARLLISLAKIFGELESKEAIPFLIEHIGLQIWPSPNIWTKTPEAIIQRMPAIKALIQIGPAAAQALISAPVDCSTSDYRRASIFVVSAIAPTMNDARDAATFLTVARAQADLERRLAEDGLKRVKPK